MYHSFLIHSSADGHSRLLQCPGYYTQCCDEHWGTRVSFNSGFLRVYAQQWDCWVIKQFYFQFFKESPHSPSFTESKRLFYTSVSRLLSHIQGYCYNLSKFHIYVLVYCIGVFSFWLTSLCIVSSSFIHLIRTDSNVFFLRLSNTPLCICTTAFLSIHLLMDI